MRGEQVEMFREGGAAEARFDLARFVERFEVLAEAEGGIERLRGLILNLALRGRLAAQRSDEQLPGFAQYQDGDERGAHPPFNVPTSWSWVPLATVARLEIGKTPPTKDPKYWATGDDGYAWVSIGDMPHWGGVAATERRVSELARESTFRGRIAPKGTLLMSFKLTIGKVSVLRCDGFHNEAIVSIYPHESSMRDFLFRFLPLLSGRGVAKNAIMGATLNRESLGALLVPVPPLAEQKRIVAKVDELMALLDELEAKQAAKRSVQAKLRTAALEALTSAEGPEEVGVAWERVAGSFEVMFEGSESVGDLRAAVLGLGLKGWLTRHVRKAENVDGLPSGWSRSTLGQLAAFVTSGSRSWKDYYADAGATFVRSQDIKTDALDLSSPAYVSVPDSAEGKRTRIFRDDVLITITGANVGKAAHVDRDVPEAYVSQHVSLVRLKESAVAPWVHRWLVSPSNGRGQLLGASYGDKPGLNLSQVKSVVIDLPPAAERDVIMQKIGAMLRLCDDLEAKLRRKEETAARLVEAVVRELSSA